MSQTIHLTCIDDANDRVFAESAVASDMLPESFQHDTVLTIGDDDWSVLEAEPLTRDEYEASGALELRLRRLESTDPYDALYSLPTLCNDLPPTEGPLLDGSELLLHSDDWRQIEFVARGNEALVDEELGFIAQVHRDARIDDAFRAIHLRRRIERPLHGVPVTLDDLRSAFHRSRESGVALETSSNRVSDSFAFFITPHLIVYGQSSADGADILAAEIVRHETWTPGHEALRTLATAHDLLLVDWCRCSKAASSDIAFEAVLRASPG